MASSVDTGARGGVVFRVGEELFFLPASIAMKIIPAPSIARMPGSPRELRGVALVDGNMIPVVDVAAAGPLRLGAPMLVCTVLGEQVGLLGMDIVATGRFDVDGSGEVRAHGKVARAFDVAAVIARVREGRWAV